MDRRKFMRLGANAAMALPFATTVIFAEEEQKQLSVEENLNVEKDTEIFSWPRSRHDLFIVEGESMSPSGIIPLKGKKINSPFIVLK